MNNILKHIKEYFNTFNPKDYTIYVDGVPTEWCSLHVDRTLTDGCPINDDTHRIVWDIPSDNYERVWFYIGVREIESIICTPTTMEIIRKYGRGYKFVAKRKTKEEKAKGIILRAKNALYANSINHALGYLDELKALMDE